MGIFGVCGDKLVRLKLQNYMGNLIESLCAFYVFDIKITVSNFVYLEPMFTISFFNSETADHVFCQINNKNDMKRQLCPSFIYKKYIFFLKTEENR